MTDALENAVGDGKDNGSRSGAVAKQGAST